MTLVMPTKKAKSAKLISDELIDQLLAQVEGKDAESILGETGLAGLLKKQLAERMLAGELTTTWPPRLSKARPATTAMALVPRP